MSDLEITHYRMMLLLAGMAELPAAGARALAQHKDIDVRLSLAHNESVPDDVRVTLARDKSALVAEAALVRVKDPTELVPGKRPTLTRLTALARNPNTPSDVLEELTAHPSHRVVRHLVGNPGLALESALALARAWSVKDLFSASSSADLVLGVGFALEARPELGSVWVHDASSIVRRAVARHPQVTPESVALLESYGSGFWRTALAGNPYADVPLETFNGKARELRERLLAFLGGRDAAEVCAGSTDTQVRAAKVESPTLDLLLSRQTKVSFPAAAAITARGDSFTAVEADTLARLFQNLEPYCDDEFNHCLRYHVSDTKIRVAADRSWRLRRQLLGITELLERPKGSITASARSVLKDDRSAWEMLVALSADWNGTPVGMIQTAAAV